MRFLVLGAGRMGLGVAYDLVHNSDAEAITLADLDIERARSVAASIKSEKITPVQIDVSDLSQAVELMRGHDAVVSCVVYLFNLLLARAAIEAGANFCDLGGNNSVVAEELALDAQARAAGINIIPDCGLAPGMVSVLVAHAAQKFDSIHSIHIRVGGLPQHPRPPLNYQLTFSVEGLINEYVERARLVRDGRIIEVESLTEVERLEFPEPFGDMEAFHTSGGSSTLPDSFLGYVDELDYKTIRYPGHCEQFKLLVDLGLASRDQIEVDGVRVTPRKLLAEIMTRALPADEPDVVLVRIDLSGKVDDEPRLLRYQIIDKFDEATGLSAMMRTTAFPASIIAQMMARGETKAKGARPQEMVIHADRFVAELEKRNIRLKILEE